LNCPLKFLSKVYGFIPNMRNVDFGYKVAILSILGITIAIYPMDFSEFDFVFAQGGNAVGQDGDGYDESSQRESNVQNTDENSMCVSGESTALSCNNLSSEIMGASLQGEQGPQGARGPTGPQGEPGPQGASGQSNQIVVTIQDGERGWNPPGPDFTVDMSGIFNTYSSSGETYREDVSILATYIYNIDEVAGPVAGAGMCEFYAFDDSQIQLNCDSRTGRPADGASLTLVINSPNRLTP
jgi:hypothetical protein